MIEKLEEILKASQAEPDWYGIPETNRLKSIMWKLTPEILAYLRASFVIHSSIYASATDISIDCRDDEAYEFSSSYAALESKIKEVLGD